MKRYAYFLLLIFTVSCQTKSGESQTAESNQSTVEIGPGEILLTETKLGNLDIGILSDENMVTEIKRAFPDFQVEKARGQQDGPDYNYFEATHLGEEVFLIAMNWEDTTQIEHLRTENKMIKDQYGLSVGQTVEHALMKRPDLKFHADLHYNVFATAANSRIEYHLTGDLKLVNDSVFVASDYSVEKWQIEEMQIAFLIWR